MLKKKIFFCLFLSNLVLAQEIVKEKIVVTFYPLYIATINIVEANNPAVDVSMASPPFAGCLHDYSPSPQEMKKILGASLIVANGAGMENFLSKVINNSSRDGFKNKIVFASDDYPLLHQANGQLNPHIWVSLSGAIFQVKKIREMLILTYPKYSELFFKNGQIYIEKLEELKKTMIKELLPYSGKDIITFHEAFPYFAQEFNFNVAGVIEREPGEDPSAKDLKKIIELVRKKSIKYLFVEPQYPTKAAEIIMKETSAKLLTLDPAVTGALTPNAYLDIMKKNLIVLKEAFAK